MKELPQYIQTAGKITVVTALAGVVVFAVAFLLNIGAQELRQVEAQGLATTTVTVLNTPPQWTVDAQESTESSTSTPTNSGSAITWTAVATDSNAESYYLLICSNGNAPTPASSPTTPSCGAGATQWAVSALTNSGTQASAATTTTEVAPFAESNDWYAWVCDAVALNPRCNASSRQGSATTSSPYNVNKRPAFTAFWDNSNALTSTPGTTVTFTATSSDPDVVDDPDTVQLTVCSTNAFNTTTDACTGTTLGTSTLSASNPTATYVIPIPTQDQNYGAYGFIIDNHGHESIGVSQGSNSVLTVANATPTVAGAQIVLNDGADLDITVDAGETTGFTVRYSVADTNSCENSLGDDEIEDYVVSVFRSGIGTTSCDAAGEYNANHCYTDTVATSTWNLTCTASSTSCTYGVDSIDTTQVWDCTFPLWYIADPTDGVDGTDTLYFAQDWRAGVSGVDDNGATSTFTLSSTAGIDVTSLLAMALQTFEIPYGELEPGDRTDPLAATTTVLATGNVGIDQNLTGESMCPQYTNSVTCANSATSTIGDFNQVYATSSVTYGTASSSGNILSSTTPGLLDLNVLKSTATSTQASGITFWGINIPGTLTLAGSYRGENTLQAVLSDPSQW